MKLIPLQHNSKQPPHGVDWHTLASDDPALHETWRKNGLNVGRLLFENHLVCADFDILDAARAFYRKYMNEKIFNIVIRSPKGTHFYWQGTTRTRKMPWGDLKANGYMVDEGSTVNGIEYRAIPGYEWGTDILPFPAHLPEFQEIVTATRSDVMSLTASDTLTRITRARHWLAKAEPAISGQHGHDKLFFCCCRMFQVFHLTLEQAFPLILEYNSRCLPPFSEKDALHKLQDALQKSPQPAGAD